MSLGYVRLSSLVTSSLVTISVVGVAVLSSTAQAQSADSKSTSASAQPQLERVIVTAQRRQENLQRTPISVAAFGRQALASRNITSLQGLNGFVPNVQIATSASFGSTGATFFIRGEGQDRNSVTVEPGVGLYVDGVYLGRAESGLLRFSDIERIEVLRGPQGTLFGKNTAGGAIRIITEKPGPNNEARLELTGGSYGRHDVQAYGNVRLSDKWFARLSAYTDNRDGYVKRASDGLDLEDDHTSGGRLQLRWLPSTKLSVDISADVSRTDRHGPGYVATTINPNAIFPTLMNRYNPGVNPPYDQRWVPANLRETTYGTGPAYHRLTSWGASVEVNWDAGPFSLKSLSAYRGYNFAIGLDGDGTPVRMFESAATRTFSQYSQEFDFTGDAINDRLHWVGGLFYLREQPNENRSLSEGGIGSFGSTARFRYVQETNSYAVFGQAKFDVTQKLSLTLGGRFSIERKTLKESEPSLFPNVVVTGKHNSNAFTPRVDIQYQWTPEIMTYVSFAKGFKGGGINDRIIGVPGGGFTYLPFNDETNTTYEAGLRSELLDKRLRFNATVFRAEYGNMQQSINTLDPAIPNRSLILFENVGAAQADGVEIDSDLLVGSGLKLNASFGYLDARITGLKAGSFAGFKVGGRLEYSPRYSFSLGGQYQVSLPSGGSLEFRTDYNWSSYQLTATSTYSAVRDPAHGLLDAAVTYIFPNGRYELSVFGTNLTDAFYIQNGLNINIPFGLVQIEPGAPREFGGRITLRF